MNAIHKIPLLIAVLVSIALGSTPVKDQGVKADAHQGFATTWLSPRRISDPNAFAYMPFAAADSSGQVHIAWSANTIDPKHKKFYYDTIC